MPMLQLPIPETTETVTRPVMLDVMRQVMQLTGIPTNTNINYFGDMEKGKQLGSAIDVKGDDPNGFAHNDKVTIEVSENFIMERVPGEQIFGPDNFFMFHDAPLEIVVKPFYAQIEATITVKYRANNESQAIAWRNMIKAKISQGRNMNTHHATYSYGVPDEVFYVLRELHKLRENVAGYGEDFDRYFANNRAKDLTILTNMNGKARSWVKPETQTNILGWFDWDLPDKAEKEGDGEARTTSFAYKFNYARPDGLAMLYPIVIHNQLVDEILRKNVLEDHHDVRQAKSFTHQALNSFAGAQHTEHDLQEFGYAIPTFDEFMPRQTPHNTRRVVTALFTIDETNPRLFMNLGELGQKQFTPEILAYLKAERQYLAKPYMSAINVAFYKNNQWIDPTSNPLVIDENLNVFGTKDPDLRIQHHLRISLVTDLQLLRGGALQRLQDHGLAAIQILDAIDPTLKDRGLLPALIGDNFISKTGLLISIGHIRPNNRPSGYLTYFNSVQTLFVETTHDRI